MEGDTRVKKRSYALAFLVSSCILLFCLSLQPVTQIPEYSTTSNYQEAQLPVFWTRFITVERSEDVQVLASANPPRLVRTTYKLFGLFPIKISETEIKPEIKLYPGGHSIGVNLQAKGVMIVGQAPIIDEEGKKVFPGKEAGIEVGDVILKVDGKDVYSDQDVATAIDEAGKLSKRANLLIKHNGQIIEKSIRTVYCQETGRYRVGFYVRDEATGVGTLTFYDPKTKMFGALGHVISDVDTNQKIDLRAGSIIASSIYGIEKGKRGQPGEKIGSFVSNSKFKGIITINSPNGVFGFMEGDIYPNPYFKQPIPVAWSSEIKEGPAKIYTVLDGEKIEEFDVVIEKILKHRTDSKNMVIRVVDPDLISKTGGIIQGMSGSPIVQEGKIIGAVTHVFVNDSTRGYGVFIENMLREANLLTNLEAA